MTHNHASESGWDIGKEEGRRGLHFTTQGGQITGNSRPKVIGVGAEAGGSDWGMSRVEDKVDEVLGEMMGSEVSPSHFCATYDQERARPTSFSAGNDSGIGQGRRF